MDVRRLSVLFLAVVIIIVFLENASSVTNITPPPQPPAPSSQPVGVLGNIMPPYYVINKTITPVYGLAGLQYYSASYNRTNWTATSPTQVLFNLGKHNASLLQLLIWALQKNASTITPPVYSQLLSIALMQYPVVNETKTTYAEGLPMKLYNVSNATLTRYYISYPTKVWFNKTFKEINYTYPPSADVTFSYTTDYYQAGEGYANIHITSVDSQKIFTYREEVKKYDDLYYVYLHYDYYINLHGIKVLSNGSGSVQADFTFSQTFSGNPPVTYQITVTSDTVPFIFNNKTATQMTTSAVLTVTSYWKFLGVVTFDNVTYVSYEQEWDATINVYNDVQIAYNYTIGSAFHVTVYNGTKPITYINGEKFNTTDIYYGTLAKVSSFFDGKLNYTVVVVDTLPVPQYPVKREWHAGSAIFYISPNPVTSVSTTTTAINGVDVVTQTATTYNYLSIYPIANFAKSPWWKTLPMPRNNVSTLQWFWLAENISIAHALWQLAGNLTNATYKWLEYFILASNFAWNANYNISDKMTIITSYDRALELYSVYLPWAQVQVRIYNITSNQWMTGYGYLQFIDVGKIPQFINQTWYATLSNGNSTMWLDWYNYWHGPPFGNEISVNGQYIYLNYTNQPVPYIGETLYFYNTIFLPYLPYAVYNYNLAFTAKIIAIYNANTLEWEYSNSTAITNIGI